MASGTPVSRGQLVLETCFSSIFCSIECYVDGCFGIFRDNLRVNKNDMIWQFREDMLKLSLTCKSLRRLSERYIYSGLVMTRNSETSSRRLSMIAEGRIPGGMKLYRYIHVQPLHSGDEAWDLQAAQLIAKAVSLTHLCLINPSLNLIKDLITRMNDRPGFPSGIKTFRYSGRGVDQDWSGVWQLVESWKGLERVDFDQLPFEVEKWKVDGAIHPSIKYLKLRSFDSSRISSFSKLAPNLVRIRTDWTTTLGADIPQGHKMTCFSTFLRLQHLELVNRRDPKRLPGCLVWCVQEAFKAVPCLETVDYEDVEGRRWHFVVTRDEIGSGEITSIAMTSFGVTRYKLKGQGL